MAACTMAACSMCRQPYRSSRTFPAANSKPPHGDHGDHSIDLDLRPHRKLLLRCVGHKGFAEDVHVERTGDMPVGCRLPVVRRKPETRSTVAYAPLHTHRCTRTVAHAHHTRNRPPQKNKNKRLVHVSTTTCVAVGCKTVCTCSRGCAGFTNLQPRFARGKNTKGRQTPS